MRNHGFLYAGQGVAPLTCLRPQSKVTFQGKPSKYFTRQVQYRLGTADRICAFGHYPNLLLDHNCLAGKKVKATRYFNVGVGLSLNSGLPVNVTTGSDNNGDGVINDRPPNTPRNSLPGPGLIDLDVNLSHDFALSKVKKHAKILTVSVNSFNF